MLYNLLMLSFLSMTQITVAMRGMYVDYFENILGDPTKETSLLQFAKDNSIQYLALYGLGSHIRNNQDKLASFIQLAKNSWGILQVGAIGGDNSFFDEVNSFNKNHSAKFDVLNLEACEFWNGVCSSDYYEQIWKPILSHMRNIASENDGMIVEAYTGWPTETQAKDIASNNLIDRLLLMCYADTPVGAYHWGTDMSHSASWFVSPSSSMEIWPIFSAENIHFPDGTPNPNNHFMGDWLKQNGMSAAESIFNSMYDMDTTYWRGTNLTGFQYFSYSHLLLINCPPVASRGNPATTNISISPNTTLTFVVNGSDQNSNLRGAEWYLNDAHQISHFQMSSSNSSDRWTHTFSNSGTYRVGVILFDGGIPNLYSNVVTWTVNVSNNENHIPCLSNPRVTPTSGTVDTMYEYMVDYYDPDGNPPAAEYQYVLISNGLKGNMTLKSGKADNGTFHYTTNLPCGSYSYSFFFADNQYASAVTPWYKGPSIYCDGNPVEIRTEVSGGPVTNNIKIRFCNGPDLSHLTCDEWYGPDLPVSCALSTGQQLMFEVNLKSNNHMFDKWEFRNEQGELLRTSSASSYGFNLYGGSVYATAYFSYTPLNYCISGTVLRSDGSTILGGVDLLLTSSQQRLSLHTDDGTFSFCGILGGVPVTITPSANGYTFAPSYLVYDNLHQNWSSQLLRGDSSDDSAPLASFENVPPIVNESSSVSFTWEGQDNVSTPQNLQYQYKLIGYDTDWSALTNITNKSYDLSNGIYTFQVKAKDEAGNISELPTSYSFVVNAAPRVVSAMRIANSVWASRLTLQMPSSPTHPTQTFVLLPEHSCSSDTELVPVTIHLPDRSIASGGSDNIAMQLGIPATIIKVGTGWLVTLPQSLSQGQSMGLDIRWGKIKYFGWQDMVQIPPGFPDVNSGGGNAGAFLDHGFRMWRQAHKNQGRVSGWGSTNAWVYMDIADKDGSIVPEHLLEYLPGIPDNGSYACDFSEENGQIVNFENNMCYVWTSEKYEKVGSKSYIDNRYQRYRVISFDSNAVAVNSYEGEWQLDTIIQIPKFALLNRLYFAGKTYNNNTKTSELWFSCHNSQGHLVQNRTVFESIPQTNSGSLDCRYVQALGPNVVFLFERYHETSKGDDRREICYQVRDLAGNLVKPTTVINPSLLDESNEIDDEYEYDDAITDNTGKVWVSFSHFTSGHYENFYMIIDTDGNVWKNNTFVGTGSTKWDFRYCDKDGYLWVLEGSNLLILTSNNTQAFPPRLVAYIPNQNVGQIAAFRDYLGGTNYRLYDRWSLQSLRIDIPEGVNPIYMDIYDLNLWANNLHTNNLTLKQGNTVIWTQSGQLTGHASVPMSGYLSIGQNLITMTQDDFQGGQILITFPYISVDINCDQSINLSDFTYLAQSWRRGSCVEPDWCGGADINQSSEVDLYDLLMLAEHWLEGANQLVQGMVAYWNLDEGSGDIANDSSGNENYGNIIGAVWVTGIQGGALEFDGLDDYVEIPNSTSLNPSNSITVSAWINARPEQCKWSPIITHSEWDSLNTTKGYALEYDMNATGIRFIIDGPGGDGVISDVVSIPTDEWTFVVGVYDGSFVRLYVDDVPSNPIPCSITQWQSTGNLNIGRSVVKPERHFSGSIDEVRIYNRALSDQEISELFYNP